MKYGLDFIKLEFKRSVCNIFLWIGQILIFLNISNDASHYLGKRAYLLSEFIQQGALTVSQEMSARTVTFTLAPTLLLSIFVFARYFEVFMDRRCSEIIYCQSINTAKMIFFKLSASYAAVLLFTFVTTFVSTWYYLHRYKELFDPLYFGSIFLIYSLAPLFFWLLLSFTLSVLTGDVKLYYPAMFILWFINIFPSKYTLTFLKWTELNLQSPLADIGLWVNRTAYMVLAGVVLSAGVRLLEIKRRDICQCNNLRQTNSHAEANKYRYKSNWLSRRLLSFKVGISWKWLPGIVLFVLLPPWLNQLLPHIFNGMLSSTEVVMKILRTGEVYISLALLLYASYCLNIDTIYNTSDIVTCRPEGIRKTRNDQLQLLTLLTIILLLFFYFSIYLFVDHLSPTTYVKIILPEILLYLILPFALVNQLHNQAMALGGCFLFWACNTLAGLKLPVYITTFAPIQYMNTFAYNVNRLELIVITLILWTLYFLRIKVPLPGKLKNLMMKLPVRGGEKIGRKGGDQCR